MMDRRKFLQGMVGTAGAWALASCSRSGTVADPPPLTTPRVVGAKELAPTARRTLRIAGQDVGLPTPFGYRFPPGYFTMINFYDTLLLTDSTGALLPWLASRYDRSPDGLTYTFELRDNVRWHDGKPLTPDDVVFTFDYFAKNKAEGKLSFLLLNTPEFVRRVRVTGPRTVEFVLEKPAVTFPREVAGGVPIVPRHVWSGIADPATQDKALVIGTGPYRLASYSATEGSYLMEANDDFFLGRPFFKRIESRVVGDELNAVLGGDVDIAQPGELTPRALAPFQRSEAIAVQAGQPNGLSVLYWNLSKGGALADPRFRRACARAIDRPGIVRRLTGGNGEPGNPGFLPKGHPFRVEVEQYPYDIAAANRMLDEAGYRRGPSGARQNPDGSPLSFKLLALIATEAVTELVVDALERVGLKLEIDPTDLVFVEMAGKQFDMAIAVFGGHQGDPDLMREIYSSRVESFLRAPGYANKEFDDLADAQLVTADEAERKRLLARMQEIVAADLPLLHLYYPTPFVIYRKAVLDQVALHPNGNGPLNKQALVTGVATGGTEIRPTVG